MDTNTPIIVIELVLVFGGALLFGWWQLRSIKKDQQKAAQQKLLDATNVQSHADGIAPNNPEE